MLDERFRITMDYFRRPIGGHWLVAALVASLVLNIALSLRLKQFHASAIQAEENQSLQIGSRVPALVGKDSLAQGRSIPVTGTSVPTVVYVFRPECQWCTRNLDNLAALLSQSGSRYRVLGISLSEKGTNEYLASNRLTMEVLTSPSPATSNAYRFGATPSTILVTKDGTVAKVWTGAYNAATKAEIEAFLNIRLPKAVGG